MPEPDQLLLRLKCDPSVHRPFGRRGRLDQDPVTGVRGRLDLASPEEDQGFCLLRSLRPEQRDAAVIHAIAQPTTAGP